MIFKKLNEGEVVSAEGFSIRLSHNHLTYKEGKKAARIDAEYTVSTSRLIIYLNALKSWHPPFEAEIIDSQQRQTIFERIRQALEFLGVPYCFE